MLILVLMKYIDGMVCWELKTMRTDRMKFVLHVAAGIGEREGNENIHSRQEEKIR